MIWIAVGLAVAGVVAIIVEMFVPALGIIGAAGFGAIVASIVMVYRGFGAVIGSIYLGAAIIALPVLMVLYFKYLPRTFVGKRLIQHGEQNPAEGYSSFSAEKYADLTGKEGVAFTVLRPAGIVLIDGKKYNAVSAGEFIDEGRPIGVLKVEGSRIVVRARRNT